MVEFLLGVVTTLLFEAGLVLLIACHLKYPDNADGQERRGPRILS
jgi:hypothetical protein